METKKSKDNGAVMIVEATFVFPIVFIILLFLIYLGNAYFIKARIDTLVTQYAISGAAECADPLLKTINSGGMPTSSKQVDVKPYRYIFTGYMNTVAESVRGKIKDEISSTGFFKNMSVNVKCDVKANTKLFYSTFSVEADYSIKIPVIIFGEQLDLLEFKSRADIPITDTGEFIRNVDMAVDFVESNKVIQDAMSKVSEFLNKVGGGKN